VAPWAVRPLVPADVPRVAAIERAAFGDPWPAAAFSDLLAQPHVRSRAVEGPDGRLVGYAFASVAADQGEILNLAVDPGARRLGFGHRLLEELIAIFRREGVAAAYLEVRESNTEAIRLYRSAGFRPTSTRRAYYRNPTEDALTMGLDLAAEGAEKR
jgi:ribosomal-protein-alanine N-acetyltransferase